MTTSYVTAYIYTSTGGSYIYTAGTTDGQFTALTDAITGQGLGSLQGQTITKMLCYVDNYITEANGIVIVDPQNVPQASLPVARIEDTQPQWQMVNIGPVDLNWVIEAYTTAAVA